MTLLSSFKIAAIIFDLGGVLIREPEAQLEQKIFKRVFEFVELIGDEQSQRKWLLGELSAAEIVTTVQENIDNPEYESFFQNSREKEIVRAGIESILLPQRIAALSQLIPEGLEFVKHCKQNNIRVLIFSNWDPASFLLIKNKFAELFSLFAEQDIFIPSRSGYIKPDLESFDFILQQTGLNKHDVLFLDDSLGNVHRAREYGIEALCHSDWKTYI